MNRGRRVLPIIIFLLVCGCGGTNRASVKGKVTMDGVALETGSIAFMPTVGTTSPTAGAEIIQGNYTVAEDKGPLPGSFKVTINSRRKTGKKIEAGSPAPPGTFVEETVEFVPAKYNSATVLKAMVKPGANEINFDLQSK